MITRAVNSYDVGATAPKAAVRESLARPERNLYEITAQPKIMP